MAKLLGKSILHEDNTLDKEIHNELVSRGFNYNGLKGSTHNFTHPSKSHQVGVAKYSNEWTVVHPLIGVTTKGTGHRSLNAYMDTLK